MIFLFQLFFRKIIEGKIVLVSDMYIKVLSGTCVLRKKWKLKCNLNLSNEYFLNLGTRSPLHRG